MADPEPGDARHAPRRDVARDLLLVVALTLLSSAVSAYFELSEWLYLRTRQFEALQLDELPVALIALTLGLVWFSHRRYLRTRIELAARAEAEARLARALAENRELAHRHLSIQEAERKHLARELHDELGQYLNAIKLDAVSIRDHTSGEPAFARKAAAAIVASVDHVHAAVSDMIRRLRPVGLDELGLTAAIESCVDSWRQRSPRTRFTLAFDGRLDGLGEALDLTVFRLIQEALTNCQRHAQAQCVDISLRRHTAPGTDEVVLRVADDGRGMDPGARRPGFGVSGMQERVEMMGGVFRLESRPGEGLALTARLPLQARSA
ncbi:MAG TPA: sensor histidine kinase [Gammaproteobacteria bacterium]|jgi:signal transduction histidine kinase|nr:sensor histidine kinase [Gammaproteobacteria bacterium]